MMNKKAEELLYEELIFIILVIIFYVVLFLFTSRVGTGASFVEQTYAKKIGLLIDQSKPGTNIEIEINEVFEIADKNHFSRQETITISNEENKVIVRADEGKGYTFEFFSENTIKWGVNTKSGKLVLEII